MANIPKVLALVATSATILSLAMNPPAQAITLFDNGVPDLQAAVPNDQSNPFFLFKAGDDFTLNNAASITKVTWSGIYSFGSIPTDNFSVRLFNIVGGVSEINPFVTLSGSFSRIDSGLAVIPDAKVYNYGLALDTPFSVEAGSYLLSIVNNTEPSADWAWVTHNFLDGNFYIKEPPRDTWQNVPGELSFAIEGNTTPVPTPALLPGLIGLGLGVWRKRKAEA